MFQDPEISAMSAVLDVFKDLNNGQRKRIINWISHRFGIVKIVTPIPKPGEKDEHTLTADKDASAALPAILPGADSTMDQETVSENATEIINVSSAPLYDPEDALEEDISSDEEDTNDTEDSLEDEEQETTNDLKKKARKSKSEAANIEPIDVTAEKEFLSKFDTLEDIFLSASVETAGSKILLVSAYLQAKEGKEYLISQEINDRLKHMGYGFENISAVINTLLKRKTPLMALLRKRGPSKTLRHRLVVTPEGFKQAVVYLENKQK